tara:strand:+ start:127 stop:1830 length:1704 start_codon:yes stop_codon:yes gene_type:complete
VIHFKSISWKNFLSTGNTPIEIKLDNHPTNLIIGKNGSGKSTLLDALCFVLFNKPFRIIKKEQMVNTINNGGCNVTIEFSVGTKNYKVIRSVKPNKFEIYKDDVLVNQDASTIDYQKYLERNIMKLNYRSFIQVVLLGSSSYEPFMKMKSRYRREAVEEILDVRVFTLMDYNLRDQQRDLGKSVSDLRHSCDLIEQKVLLQAEHLKSLKSRIGDAEESSRIKIEQNKEADRQYRQDLQQLNENIAKQQEIMKFKPDVDKKAKKLSKLESKIENNLETHKETLTFFETHDECPTCTQSIPKDLKSKKVEEEKTTITKLESGLQDIMSEITKVETQITQMDVVSKKIQEMNINVAKIHSSLEGIKKHSDDVELNATDGQDSDKLEKELEDLSEKLNEQKTELIKLSTEKDYVDVIREILSDKGARAQIIKKYLPIMNQLINKYLQSMDFFVSFTLDEEFNETVKSRHRDTFSYNSFSEGEKMRIDLALLFTWRTIAKMKNSTNTNLLILDEIFDSSLDGSGTEDFFKILGTMSNENVFIISHKGDILFDKFTNIIKFEKEHNFTKLEDV